MTNQTIELDDQLTDLLQSAVDQQDVIDRCKRRDAVYFELCDKLSTTERVIACIVIGEFQTLQIYQKQNGSIKKEKIC